jgi:Helicase associated domain
MPSSHPSSRDLARSYFVRWEEGFSYLRHFSDREGHCRVSQRYKTEEGYRLGQWVKVQRTNKKGLDPDRRKRLEALTGWDWDPISTEWEESFCRLKHFSEREGHCVVTRSYTTVEGYRLGIWVSSQRKKKDLMCPKRRSRLEALPGWSWDPFAVQWEKGFSRLKQFLEREGHCRVARSHTSEDGYRLGVWVNRQRLDKNLMYPDRRQRLEALAGWSWKPHSDLWEVGFSHLKHFSEREGHCRVSLMYKTEDGYRLGQWVRVQRTNEKRMAPHRHQRLNALPGWLWRAR